MLSLVRLGLSLWLETWARLQAVAGRGHPSSHLLYPAHVPAGWLPGPVCPHSRCWGCTGSISPSLFKAPVPLAGYSSWGCKELDTTEQHTHIMRLLLGEQKCSVLIVVVITLLYILVKIHWIVYIKLVNWWTEHMNLFTNRSSHHGYQRIGGIGINWEIKIDVYTLPYIKQIMRTHCIAQGTLLNTLSWPIWEKNLKRVDICICITDFTLLYTWN